MIHNKIKKAFFSILSLVSVLLIGCNPTTEYQSVSIAMGTMIQQKIWSKEDITGTIETQLAQIEAQLLSTDLETSYVYQINETGMIGEGVIVSSEFLSYLQKIEEISNSSQGALDITMGTLIELWDFNSQTESLAPQVPSEQQILEAMMYQGYENIYYEDHMILLKNNIKINLGAVGKGIASNLILETLRAQEDVSGAIISLGGCIITYGEKEDGSDWVVGIQNPQKNQSEVDSIGTLVLSGEWVVSTSGDYERFFEVDDTIYHHILDPSTGYPVDHEVSSVTILCKDGLVSDALSTACFVLGVEDGLALAKEYEAEVLFVKKSGEIVMSEGMIPFFKS